MRKLRLLAAALALAMTAACGDFGPTAPETPGAENGFLGSGGGNGFLGSGGGNGFLGSGGGNGFLGSGGGNGFLGSGGG